jgi:hypothetical protein
MTYLTRRIVKKQFRLLIAYLYPGLGDNKSYWNMMEHLIFGAWSDKTTGRLLLNRDILASIEGKWKDLKNNKYEGLSFLESFRRDVFNNDKESFDWQEAINFKDGSNNRARTLTNFKLHPEIVKYFEEEMEEDTTKEVYFSSGIIANDLNKRKYRNESMMEALEHLHKAQCLEAEEILKYLNGLRVDRFSKLVNNYESAFQQAQIYIAKAEEYEKKHPPKKSKKNLSFAQRLMTEHSKRKFISRTFSAIFSQIQPFYQPSSEGNTVRLFSLTDSLLMLPRNVRKAMTEGWWEFDLRSSQLAICAKEWNVPLVMEFLKTGQSIWTVLFKHMGLDHLEKGSYEYDLVKDSLKVALYALFFGMEIPNIKKKLTEELKVYFNEGITAGQLFFKNEIIQAMAEARQRRMDELILAEVAYTIYGKKIEVWHDPVSGESNINSVLAEQAQAIEMYLMFPIIELARSTEEFEVLIWLHDGVSIAFKNESKRACWTKKIQNAVAKRATELGIITELEVDYNQPTQLDKIPFVKEKILKLQIGKEELAA